MSELKPCPFCGGETHITGVSDFRLTSPRTGHRAACSNCHAYGGAFATREGAIESWNRRTQPEATKPAPKFVTCPKCKGNHAGIGIDGVETDCSYCENGMVQAIQQPKEERTAFEAWAGVEYRNSSHYTQFDMEYGWDAWQARAALASPADAQSTNKKEWRGSLAQVVCDVPLPKGSKQYLNGFVTAKEKILNALGKARFDALVAGDRVDAERWRMFTKALRTYLPGPGHGVRIKVVEICPMYGEETEVENLEKLLDRAIQAQKDGHG